MNSGLVTSFIIGGLLMISILALNLNVTHSSASLTLRQVNREKVESISEVLTHDMLKIGFEKYNSIPDPIIAADSNRIVFKSNIDNTGSYETVEWFFDRSAPVASTLNADDYTLIRKVGGTETNIKSGLTTFYIEYKDKNMNPLSTVAASQTERNKIRHITISMMVESGEKLGKMSSGGADYIRSSWSKTFSPQNIK